MFCCGILRLGSIIFNSPFEYDVFKCSFRLMRNLFVSYVHEHDRSPRLSDANLGPVCRVWQVHARDPRDISRKLKENGAKNGSARTRSRQVLPYSANWTVETAVFDCIC